MSQTLRQNNLFAGQDWTVIYQAMSQINFSAYDFDSIRQALVDYIRINYPEEFNDWIDSSEFVAIIEMLAYLAGSLAFRIDLNTRENFLDTATRRDSILRLARMLSYSPRRCIASQGLLKLNSVVTDQQVFDSNGINLSNVRVTWNDANNPDWYEQFVIVLNASFVPSNPFGQPVKSGAVGTVNTDRYDFSNTLTSTLAYPFSGVVSGTSMTFEMCNVDFTTQNPGSISIGSAGYFSEKTPSIFNPFSVLYRNDGNGNASPNTGFFALFKEGSFGFTDYILNTPIANRVIDVAAININQSDVWVQTVDDNGLMLANWTRVPAIAASNLVYNDVNRLTRNIFQVITRDNNGNDSISIRFGDGAFGNIPTGRIRVYYRTSNNLTYTILPTDLSSVGLNFNYVNSSGGVNNLQMTYSLSSAVANSLSRETAASIQDRAPAVFYTQNRMVNGEDYNVFPLQSSEALKVKAVNRVYSGQSRHIDINDPTANYQNTKVFSDDGILYQENANSYNEIRSTLNFNSSQIIDTYIQPLLTGSTPTSNVNVEIRDFYLTKYPRMVPSKTITWISTGTGTNSTSTGNFQQDGGDLYLPDSTNLIRAGSMIQFSTGQWSYVIDEGNSAPNYVPVISGIVPSGSTIVEIIPSFNPTLTSAEYQNIQTAIDARGTFGITFYQTPQMVNGILVNWLVINRNNIAEDAEFDFLTQGNIANLNQDASWLIQMKWVSGIGWELRGRGTRYVFESLKDVRFYNIGNTRVMDPSTGLSQQDNIRVLRVNSNPVTGMPIGQDLSFGLRSQEIYPDGYTEPRRVRVSLWDANNDGIPDNPDEFSLVVNTNWTPSSDYYGVIDINSFPYVFWKTQTVQGFDYLLPFSPSMIQDSLSTLTTMLGQWNSETLFVLDNRGQPVLDTTTLQPVKVTTCPWNDGDIVYLYAEKLFLQYNSQVLGGARKSSFSDVSSVYHAAPGRAGLYYSWQHVVPSQDRVNPAIMNIIDAYVLTSSYDTALRNWISKGRATDPMPQPPTPESLRMTFQDFEKYKMMTDQMIWHPVSYKILFGAMAAPEFRVSFKVVKIPGVGITDSELKSLVIQAVNNYFSIVNWDFGQSFFFTELAAYIHQQNPALLSSVVIVPLNADSKFGDLFEISCDPDEIFISSARVTDVQIVPSLNPSELRLS